MVYGFWNLEYKRIAVDTQDRVLGFCACQSVLRSWQVVLGVIMNIDDFIVIGFFISVGVLGTLIGQWISRKLKGR